MESVSSSKRSSTKRTTNQPRSSRTKKSKTEKRCDASDAVESIIRLTETTLKVNVAPGWEVVLPKNGDDDPGVLILWDAVNVRQTLASINDPGGGVHPLPTWLRAGAPLDENTLMTMILTRVQAKTGSGGVVGNCIIAPNDMVGYGRILQGIYELYLLPFFIEHAVCPLGHVYVMTCRRNEAIATRAPTMPPFENSGGVHLFH